MKDDLSRFLETMDVPEMRLVLTPANIRWLLRNLRVNNADHPDLAEVTLMLKDQIRREDVLHFNIFDHRS